MYLVCQSIAVHIKSIFLLAIVIWEPQYCICTLQFLCTFIHPLTEPQADSFMYRLRCVTAYSFLCWLCSKAFDTAGTRSQSDICTHCSSHFMTKSMYVINNNEYLSDYYIRDMCFLGALYLKQSYWQCHVKASPSGCRWFMIILKWSECLSLVHIGSLNTVFFLLKHSESNSAPNI